MIKKIIKAPLSGFSYFIKNPELWPKPLAMTFFVYFYFLGSFLIVLKASLPTNSFEVGSYLTFYKSLAVALAISLSIWFLLISLLYAFIIFNLFANAACFKELHLSKKIKKILGLLYSNGAWRLFWILVVSFTAVYCGPISIVFSQVALAHVALLDGALLTKQIKSRPLTFHFGLLCGAVFGGLVAFLCIPTIIIWLFWIPSLYIGTHELSKEEG
jgi:hypothetical protein